MKHQSLLSQFIIVISFSTLLVLCQENAQLRVPNSLVECYRDPFLNQPDNRLPMTIGTLIELIRKIEDIPGYSNDIRQLTTSVIHRFRQDGIERAPGITETESVLPFSPAGFQFSKFRILLSRLIPGSASNFPNDTLSAVERCTLHFMLSSSIDTRVRGDEATRCSQLAQFRAMRGPRFVDTKSETSKRTANNFIGDVEFLEWKKVRKSLKKKPLTGGRLVNVENDDYDDEDDEDGFSDVESYGLFDIASNAVSQCPVENGVIWTPWGAVNAGNLIAGIAAGLEPQKVQLRRLLDLARRPGSKKGAQSSANVDNRWAATLAGDLAEIALIQGPEPDPLTVGAAGAWNSTTLPKWYFLNQRERLQMTDAEIRGGLDGLIIATKIAQWRTEASNLLLSQLLDMYYSTKGVLNSGVRACDRRKEFSTVAPLEELKAQAYTFATVLDREMQLRVTMEELGIQKFASDAAEALSRYIPQSLNDLSCETTAVDPNDNTLYRINTDLFLFIDTTWMYEEINPIISYILQYLNFWKLGTTVTIFNAMTGDLIVNRTNSRNEVFQLWNDTTHRTQKAGFNLPNVLRTLHTYSVYQLDEEKRTSSSGGKAFIALIVPQLSGVNEGDTTFALERIQLIREEVPDLRIMFSASGSVVRFENFVKSSKDLFTIRAGENVASQTTPIVKRIMDIPRRITNYRCGSTYQADETGRNDLVQYVDPGSIVYYRLHPNYFFKDDSNRKLHVQAQGASGVTVCSSRLVERPRSNSSTTEDVLCKPVSSEAFEVDLSSPCSGYSSIRECPPLYVAVEASKNSGASQVRCTEAECQAPDQIRFVIQTENLGCYSSAERIVGSFLLVLLSVLSKFKHW